MEKYEAKTLYSVPVFCGAGVSHYVPVKVTWLLTRCDDGADVVELVEMTITEHQYGEG